MAAYASNILPLEAAYYDLTNAVISDGVLTFNASGSAVFNVTVADLPTLTNSMRVSVVADTYTDEYEPGIYVRIHTELDSGEYVCHLCSVTTPSEGPYTSILHFPEGVNYTEMQIEIFSEQPAVLRLWEICPEASEDMQVVIDGVTQSLPRLLYDYNTWPLVVEQREVTIALISCNLLRSTDLQGHFQLSYVASLPATLTLRFKDNDSTELFAPLIYDISAGRGSIGVPHAYLSRLAGYHNFVVTAHMSEGTLSIGTRNLLFTIDGGYLADRTSNMGNTISDVAVEQKATDASPSYLWVASVEAGEAVVRRRAFTPKVVGESFVPVYSLGRANLTAIEFDGEWVLNPPGTKPTYRFNTFGNPWCFFTDTHNMLHAQIGDDESTRVTLDDNVYSISVCRGFKSSIYTDQDQGIICAYKKIVGTTVDPQTNKTDYIYGAFYVQYLYNNVLKTFEWSEPFELTRENRNVINVSVHRLNDYRVGFIITDELDKNEPTSIENMWYISDRTYVGMSVPTELIEVTPNANYAALCMIKGDYAPLTVKAYVINSGFTVRAEFNHPVRCVSPNVLAWMKFPSELLAGVPIYGSLGSLERIGQIEGVEIHDNFIDIHLSTSAAKAFYTFSLYNTNAWQFYTGHRLDDEGGWIGMTTAMSWSLDPRRNVEVFTSDNNSISINTLSASCYIEQIPLVRTNLFSNNTITLTPIIHAELLQQATVDTYAEYTEHLNITVNNIEASLALSNIGTEPI